MLRVTKAHSWSQRISWCGPPSAAFLWRAAAGPGPQNTLPASRSRRRVAQTLVRSAAKRCTVPCVERSCSQACRRCLNYWMTGPGGLVFAVCGWSGGLSAGAFAAPVAHPCFAHTWTARNGSQLPAAFAAGTGQWLTTEPAQP